ncbi:hypothetical protein ACP4OV_003135 [Aristida adscensionis]
MALRSKMVVLLLVFVATAAVPPAAVVAVDACPSPQCYETRPDQPACTGDLLTTAKCKDVCMARGFVDGRCQSDKQCYCNTYTLQSECWQLQQYLCVVQVCDAYCKAADITLYEGGICQSNTCWCKKRYC